MIYTLFVPAIDALTAAHNLTRGRWGRKRIFTLPNHSYLPARNRARLVGPLDDA